MGYRSDVSIAVNAKKVQAMDDVIDRAFKNVFGKALAETADGDRLYYRKGVKWYVGVNGNDDVTKILDFLEEYRDDDEEYLFVVIGEYITDITMQGHWYDNPWRMGLERRITFDLTPS